MGDQQVVVAGADGILPPTIAAHRGFVVLIEDPGYSTWYLIDTRTNEVVKILNPPLGEKWELDFTTDLAADIGFISTDSETHWVIVFLK